MKRYNISSYIVDEGDDYVYDEQIIRIGWHTYEVHGGLYIRIDYEM